ncbi:hypothetical protein Hanom_Chr15g01375061 [Helianthus anomalus]
MKRRLLEQNGAKMVHSSKLPDMALPCQTVARPCQAFRHRYSQPALASISQIIKTGEHDRARPKSTPDHLVSENDVVDSEHYRLARPDHARARSCDLGNI